ncbi:hypothetical protein HDU96_004664 [Phlyctochytrium bullatum]|nr:hypothetical protein HDU96_004664 [Phlyctochytrium bullatum]
MAGTPEKLIERLTDDEEKEDPTPEDIEYFTKMKSPVQKGIVNVITWWVEYQWHDFGVNPQLRRDLEEFVDELVLCKETDFTQERSRLMTLIRGQVKRYEDMILSYRSVERKGKTMESMFAELSHEELGQQLCLHNFKLFRNIHPIEFLHQIWKKDDEATPFLDFFIERFDKESYWTVTEIVSQKDPKKRAKVLAKFILTAKAIGEKVKKIHSELEEVCDPSRNMKNYRDCLAASSPPIVPFLPIYLKDLTFINDGNASQVNGMVNFDKLRMMGKRVKDISSLASTEFKFEPNPAIQNYLAKPPIEKSMTKLKELSLECEK